MSDDGRHFDKDRHEIRPGDKNQKIYDENGNEEGTLDSNTFRNRNGHTIQEPKKK